MQPATTWGLDPANPFGPSVEARLQERCQLVASPQPIVVVLVFALPDSWSAAQLAERREYFDLRSGPHWDIFFPGYYRYGSMGDAQQVQLDDHWGFSPRAFDDFRRDLEARTDRRWRFSGETELVAMNAFLTSDGPAVDFSSAVSGPLTEHQLAVTTRTIAQAIERLGQQYDDRDEAADYGLGEVLGSTPASSRPESALSKIGIGAAGGVAAAVVRNSLGMP